MYVANMQIALQDLGRAVKQLQYRHHRGMDRKLREVGTSLAQWDGLRAISRRPNSSAHALAEMTFQTDQSFGTLAARMIDRGLIERVPGPGRAVKHRVTAKGDKVRAAGGAVMDEVLAHSFSTLTPAELEEFGTLIRRLLRNF